MSALPTRLTVIVAFVLLARHSTPLHAQDQIPSKEVEPSKRLSDRIEAIVDDALRSLRFEFGYVDSTASLPSVEIAVVDSTQESLSYDGATTIAAGDTLLAHVVVKGGDLTVCGVLRGDVLVVGGSLIVKSGGRVTGNARVIIGQILRDEGAVIEGTHG